MRKLVSGTVLAVVMLAATALPLAGDTGTAEAFVHGATPLCNAVGGNAGGNGVVLPTEATSRVMKKSKMGRSGSSAGPISYLVRQEKSTHVHQAAPLSAPF